MRHHHDVDRILEALKRASSVAEAARMAQCSRTSVYRLAEDSPEAARLLARIQAGRGGSARTRSRRRAEEKRAQVEHMRAVIGEERADELVDTCVNTLREIAFSDDPKVSDAVRIRACRVLIQILGL